MPEFKYGRLPAKRLVGLEFIDHYFAGKLPKPPASVPVPGVTAWGMLGNADYGDCGVAGYQHLLMAGAAATGTVQEFPTEKQTISYYLKYTGGQDDGVVLADFLAYVHKHGYYGHTVAGTAPVRVDDLPTLQFALWAYDGVYCGITVTQQMEADFQAGRPWTMESLDSPEAGGHCVPAVGYDSLYVYVVTWGKIQAVAWSAWHHMADEAHAVITDEQAKGDGHGLNLAALKADLAKVAK